MPFMLATILAYMGDPLVDRLEKLHIRRTPAVVLVFVMLTTIALIALLLFVPMLEKQILLLAKKIPLYISGLRDLLEPTLASILGEEVQLLDWQALQQSLSEYWTSSANTMGKLMGSISKSGMVLAGVVVNAMLVPVVTFYLLRDWDVLVQRIHALIPRDREPVIARLARDSDEVLGAFVRGQLLVMLALGTIYSLGLKFVVGLDLALLIGLIAGVVSFVPYLGFIIGILLASVAALMQFHDFFHLLHVAGVFAVGQMLEGMVLTPLLVGDRIGLHPVAVIFAVMAGGQLFGFFGILLALPTAAVVVVLVRYLHDQYLQSNFYQGQS
jgi:predicted PurR-regulated permease PerM